MDRDHLIMKKKKKINLHIKTLRDWGNNYAIHDVEIWRHAQEFQKKKKKNRFSSERAVREPRSSKE